MPPTGLYRVPFSNDMGRSISRIFSQPRDIRAARAADIRVRQGPAGRNACPMRRSSEHFVQRHAGAGPEGKPIGTVTGLRSDSQGI